MNPFKTAQDFGYGSEEILKFAANAIPGLEDKIKYALAAGYGADEVIKFLQNSFKGKIPKSLTKQRGGDDRSEITKSMGAHEPDPVMQMKAYAKQRNIGDLLDPGRLALQAGGAAAGFAMGGPAGAVAGAYGGTEAHEDLLKKYEEHLHEGGQMEFADFLKSMMKGGAKGIGAHALISQIPKILAALQASKDSQNERGLQVNDQGSDNLSPSPDDIVINPEDISSVPSEQPQPPTTSPQKTPEESFQALEKEGFGKSIQGFASKMSQKDFVDYMKSEIGGKKFRHIGHKLGAPPEQIFASAWEFVQGVKPGAQQAQGDPEAAQPQPTQGIPTEASVEADVLEEMAGGPGVAVDSIDESVSPSVKRSVKPLDSEEENSLADVFNKTFSGEEEKADPKAKKRRIKPLENALKSSNVRGGQWNAETGDIRIIFQPNSGQPEGGSVYTYPNVDKKSWEDLTGGKATPLTEGSNIFGFWDRGKKTSIGAAFSKKIKKNPEKYPPNQIEEKDITVGENQIRTADRAFMVSDLFEPFKKVREEGRRNIRSSDLQDWVKDYAGHAPEDIVTMIEIIEGKLKSTLKNPPADARLKKEITSEFGVTFKQTEKEKEKQSKKEAKTKQQLEKKAARELAKKRRK